jgi:signal transduction histidine kinase
MPSDGSAPHSGAPAPGALGDAAAASPQKASAIRILHLENKPEDAELVRELLTAEWPDIQITVVTSRFAYIGELQLRSYDLILADFAPGSFHGLEALKIARQRWPEIPFIFFSGTLDEDKAVEALQSGARDYVLKGQMKRLRAILRSVVKEGEERRNHRQVDCHSRELEASLLKTREAIKRLEEQSQRMQRLENVGLMAAGVAHDLNNMLSPMLMAAPLLRGSISDPDGRRLLDNLEKSAVRGAALVGQILAFSQGGKGEQQMVQLEILVRDIVMFMEQTFPKNLQIEKSIPMELWPLRANPAQIYQMLLNLCINARDAMAQGGRLSVHAENCVLDESSARRIAGARAGSFVVLQVDDTGCGIPPEVVERIWEPLVPDKVGSKGAGLGLPTVRSIVKRHGGFIQLQTVVGLGTSFRVYLPVAGIPDGASQSQPFLAALSASASA